MKQLILFCLLFFAWGMHSLSAQQGWKLVYEHDSEGKAVQGELSALVEAIQAGKSIRIYYRSHGTDRYVEHTADIKFTTILNSDDGIFVTGQIHPIIGQTPDFPSWLPYL